MQTLATRHYEQAGSGLTLAPFRAYDSETGRWISPDPLGQGAGPNEFAYSSNDPIALFDPLGLCPANQEIVQGATISAGAILAYDGLVRGQYERIARELVGSEATALRTALRSETYERLSPLGKAITDYLRLSRGGQLDNKTVAELAESASRTSSGVNAAGAAARVAGPALLVVGAGMSAYNIASAPAGQRGTVVAEEVGAWAGALAGGALGAKSGAVIGSFFGPGPGTAIGAGIGTLVGGALGAIGGSHAGGAIYQSF
jgi:RHS repeat-associated protein